MNGNQLKWLFDLQSKGVKFEYCNMKGEWVNNGRCTFFAAQKNCRIPAQPIPDIPDWRELCREMQSKGVMFEYNRYFDVWDSGECGFVLPRIDYRIPQQPIPEWKDPEMAEETKPDQREEIPHRELQIQWHEDMLHHLRTGEPMREWQWRKLGGAWQWLGTTSSTWNRCFYYRRKPRTVTYWHCLVEGCGTNGVVYLIESTADALRKHVKSLGYEVVGHVTETTVDLAD